MSQEKNKDKRNLILIGMPGAGKSTIGRALADRMGMTFCDTDDLLRAATGMTLVEILDTYGVDGFIECENRLCATLDLHDTVIATGGSVVYGAEAMAHLGKIGRVIYPYPRTSTFPTCPTCRPAVWSCGQGRRLQIFTGSAHRFMKSTLT